MVFVDGGLVVKRSALGYGETTQRLLREIERRGLRLFAQVDHAAAAREVGMDLGDEQVLIFGDPRGGTPLMQDDPRIGIDLPLRILVWRDDNGTVLGYRDPRELGARYEVGGRQAILEAMANLLHELVREATAPAV
jgi:uncharacterized protein (DUF302 family)